MRFLAHRDCARLVERAALRAGLPLRYTCGFNPHPAISLVCPRPVGVASRDDLAVLELTDPRPADWIVRQFNRQTPPGFSALRARPLEGRRAPRVRSIRCEMRLPAGAAGDVARHLAAFQAAETWPVERRKVSRRGPRGGSTRRVDLKRLVAGLELDQGRLAWTLQPDGDLWARPAELLQALGLDPRADLAAVRRTRIDYDFPDACAPSPQRRAPSPQESTDT